MPRLEVFTICLGVLSVSTKWRAITPRPDLKNGIAAIALVLAIIVSAGVGYLGGVANQHTTTVSTTTLPQETVTKINTVPDLQLFASVKPSDIAAGQNVTVVAGVYNPLRTSVTVSARAISNPAQGPCGLGVIPTGIRVYSGHYAFTNLSSATPLLLYNASLIFHCPALFNNTYTFQPNSANATVSYLGTSTKWVANETISLSGYWTTGLLTGPNPGYIFRKFGPGSYTVVVFDAWDQQLLVYFEVS